MAKKKKTKKKNTKKTVGFRFILMLFLLALMSVMFLPTTLLLAVGMLPTLVAFVIDTDPAKNKSFTIGAMNFAGCFPFLLGIWQSQDAMYAAISYLADPKTVVVMYSAALLGYMINWIVAIAISSLLVKRAQMRIKKIEEQKLAMEERWGVKVNGMYNLDEYGFPIQQTTSDDT